MADPNVPFPHDAVDTPLITPNGGTFIDSVVVTLSTDTPDPNIFYTIDDSEPNQSSILYEGQFTISASTTIKAKAFKDAFLPSDTASAMFTIETTPPETVSTPLITPNGGTFIDSVMVTLSTDTPDPNIFYTIDDSEPNQSSFLYEGPFIISASTTIKAKAFKDAFLPSDTASATFTIETMPLIISNVQVTSSDVSANVRWTTNEPATSTVYYGLTSDYGVETALTITNERRYSYGNIGLVFHGSYVGDLECYNNLVLGLIINNTGVNINAGNNICWDYEYPSPFNYSNTALGNSIIAHPNYNMLEHGMFVQDPIDFSWPQDQIRRKYCNQLFQDFHLVEGAPAINYGNPAKQTTMGMGTIDPNGFIRDDGMPRDALNRSAGAYEFSPIQLGYEDELISFTIHADDPEVEAITYSALTLPSGAIFDEITGDFAWIPSVGQAGQYEIIFTIYGDTATYNRNVVIIVYPKYVFLPEIESATENAMTYYLDAVNGNDNNDGSINSPWRTMGKATALGGGNTVIVANGHYGSLRDNKARGDWLTIRAASGAKPRLYSINVGPGILNWGDKGPWATTDVRLRVDGFIVTAPVGFNDYIVKSIGGNYFEILNSTIAGSPNPAGYNKGYWDIDRSGVLVVANHTKVHRCDISNVKRGIELKQIGYPNVNHVEEITNNYVHDCSNTGIFIFEQARVNIEYNHIYRQQPYKHQTGPAQHGSGIGVISPEVSIRYNIVHSYGNSGGINYFTVPPWDGVNTNAIIENNLVYDSGGMRIAGIKSGCKVNNNTVIGHDDANVTVDNSDPTTDHSLILTYLDPNTIYHYQVISIDGSGNIAESNDLTFTTNLSNTTGQLPVTLSADTPDANVLYTIDNGELANYITFDVEFTSDPDAAGILAVYWDQQHIADIDERYALEGVQEYAFMLPSTYKTGFYSLKFSIDFFSSVVTTVTINNIRAGVATAGFDYVIDGKIDLSDFAFFAARWAVTGCDETNDWCQRADLDQYGSVDPNDLMIFTQHWLEGASL